MLKQEITVNEYDKKYHSIFKTCNLPPLLNKIVPNENYTFNKNTTSRFKKINLKYSKILIKLAWNQKKIICFRMLDLVFEVFGSLISFRRNLFQILLFKQDKKFGELKEMKELRKYYLYESSVIVCKWTL